jgi:hypothetical protein
MEPVTLATLAVGLLVTFVKKAGEKIAERTGERAGEAGADVAQRLYALIKRRLSGEQYDAQMLAGVESDPRSTTRVKNLEAVVAEHLEKDPVFASEIEGLVTEARSQGQISVSAEDSGMTAGGDMNLRAGGDISGRDRISYAPPPVD